MLKMTFRFRYGICVPFSNFSFVSLFFDRNWRDIKVTYTERIHTHTPTLNIFPIPRHFDCNYVLLKTVLTSSSSSASFFLGIVSFLSSRGGWAFYSSNNVINFGSIEFMYACVCMCIYVYGGRNPSNVR